jgi:chromosome segregation ATPase
LSKVEADLTQALAAQRAETAALAGALARLRDESAAALSARDADLAQALATQRAETAALAGALARLRDESAAALSARDADLAQAAAAQAALRTALDEARAKLRTARLHQTDSVLALADQDRQTREAAALVARHQSAAEAAGRQQNRLQTALTKAEAHLARLRTDLAAEQARATALEQRLAEVYASTSWRITGPMRGTRRLFDRKARNH